MHTPQIVFIILMCLSQGLYLGKGDKKGFVKELSNNIIILALLIWGGFFK